MEIFKCGTISSTDSIIFCISYNIDSTLKLKNWLTKLNELLDFKKYYLGNIDTKFIVLY